MRLFGAVEKIAIAESEAVHVAGVVVRNTVAFGGAPEVGAVTFVAEAVRVGVRSLGNDFQRRRILNSQTAI